MKQRNSLFGSIETTAKPESIAPVDVIQATARLRAELSDGEPVVSVCSASLHRGVAKISAGLAQALALTTSERVLVLESNLRVPSVHTLLDLSLSPGLTEFVTGEAKFEDVVRETSMHSLLGVTGGEATGVRFQEFFATERYASIVALARERFRFTFINTPPLLLCPETAITVNQTDGVILVVSADRERKPEVADAVEMLSGLNARILGTILSHG